MNRQEILKLCEKCSDACKERGCVLTDLEASKDDDISPVPLCVENNMKVLYDKKKLSFLNDKILDDNNKKQQKATRIENNAFSVGKNGDMILAFLSDHIGEECTPYTLHKELGIKYNTITASLSRLHKEGKIWKPRHGYYASTCTLNRHQLQKIDYETQPAMHNILIEIPKILLSETYELPKNILLLSPTVAMKATELESDNNNQKQQKKTNSNEKYNNGEIQNISFDICPKQTLTIIEYSNKYMIRIQADENPLTIKEFLWLNIFLVVVFGGGVSKAETKKFDFNVDIPISFSPNQLTFGDIHGAVLAVYGKGNFTRVELRNFNPKSVTLGKFSNILLEMAMKMMG